ncbi:hypothetical protein FDA77_00970 [Clostridium botulinum]|nr:hypothetical protein [Clostridium botulinum]NFJ88521.1 hypothetical protein [Clostridium botulinum]HDI3121663.1 hypothetical protein [Clostridium botulinum]
MITTKKTIDNKGEIKQVINNIKDFKNIEVIDKKDIDVIFHFEIVGRKTLEFYIIGTNNEIIADVTNKTIVEKLADFKWGTAKNFSKTLVKNWDKLGYFDDGEFKI